MYQVSLAQFYYLAKSMSNYILILGIDGQEMVVIFLVILLLFGPKAIPTLARSMGRAIRMIKDTTQELQNDILSNADNPIKEEMKDIEATANDVKSEIHKQTKTFTK